MLAVLSPVLPARSFDNAALFADHSSSFHSSSPPGLFLYASQSRPLGGWLRPLRFLARSIFGVFFPFGQEPTYDRPHYRTLIRAAIMFRFCAILKKKQTPRACRGAFVLCFLCVLCWGSGVSRLFAVLA